MKKKGQMQIVALSLGLIVGIILLVAVLVPITTTTIKQAANTSAYLGSGYNETGTNSPYYTRSESFSGVQGVITSNFVTFILIGTLVLVAGIAMYGMTRG